MMMMMLGIYLPAVLVCVSGAKCIPQLHLPLPNPYIGNCVPVLWCISNMFNYYCDLFHSCK